MKKIFTISVLLVIFTMANLLNPLAVFSLNVSYAMPDGKGADKVEVFATGGTPEGGYQSLFDAFDKINQGIHTGIIQIKINESLVETASAVLFESGHSGGPLAPIASSYSAIAIYPTVTGLSITGDMELPLIDLDGADNVTIDGRVNATGAVKDLVISNTNVSTTQGTSAIRFINDASANTVKYCTLKGSSKASRGGILIFGTTTGTTGNDDNTIEHNDITNAGGNRPRYTLYSTGTGAGTENSSNTISNNNMYDFLPYTAAGSGSGIYLTNYNSAWTISGNSFYETTSFAPTTAIGFYVIFVSNTGNNYTISNNYIGGNEPLCGGTPWTKTNSAGNDFSAISVSTGVGLASNIQGNTIKNIHYSNLISQAWRAISISGTGDLNIGTTQGNVIGGRSGNDSIVISIADCYGIRLSSYSGTLYIQNNIIGAIKTGDEASTTGTHINGINGGITSGTLNIMDNTIGSATTPKSINASSPSTTAWTQMYGINIATGTATCTVSGNLIANLYNASTYAGNGIVRGIYLWSGTDGTITITNNTVRNITTATNPGSTSSTIEGIALSNTGTTKHTITGNTVYDLSNIQAGIAGIVMGIYVYVSTTESIIERNFVHDLSVASASAKIEGLFIYGGSVKCSNNIISLGNGLALGAEISGIRLNAATTSTMKFYHNTVYLGGIVTGVTANTYALRNAAVTTRDFRNNIFNNSRSGGTTGKHYAASITSITNLTNCDYNDYYAPNGVIGLLLTTDKTTLAEWQTATGKDSHSLNTDPIFAVNPPGTTATDYKPTVLLEGYTITGCETDYDFITRAAPPNIGAFEIIIALSWTGNTDSDWNTAGNWNPEIIPAPNANITIPAEPGRQPVINQAPASPAVCNTLTIASGAELLIAPGKALTVYGSLTNNASNSGLYLQSSADGTGSLIHNTDNVPATIETYITGSSNLTDHKFHFVSIPAQEISPTSNLFLDSYLYDLDATMQEASNSNYYGKWVSLGTSTTTLLNLQKGYMVYYPYDDPGNYTFIANLNNGDFSCAVIGNTGTYTFNLVPNPYPSAINWGEATGWTKSAGIGGTCYVWGSNAGNYEYLPISGSPGIIPVGQAFIVIVNNEASPSLMVKNAARVHSSQAFYKSTQEISNQLSIKAVANGYSDVTRVAFNDEATDDFDLQTDGIKMFGLEEAPQLYTLSADKKFSINNLLGFQDQRTVDMNFETNFTGEVTLSFEGLESFDPSVSLYLKDELTNQTINLRNLQVYTFIHNPENAANRFKLVFGGTIGINETPVDADKMWIAGNTVCINAPELNGQQAQVEVFNPAGQRLLAKSLVLEDFTTLELSLKGFVIVKLTSGQKVITTKGILMK